MKHFYSADSVDNVGALISDALAMKRHSIPHPQYTEGKSMLLLFFNPSLRTRLSTQLAAQQLGMHTICMNAGEGWKWEIEPGVIMNMDKAEHVKDAAKVISQYVDIVAIRSFPGLTDREEDYRDELMQEFMAHSEVTVVNMESSIYHPLQSLTDLITIEEAKANQTKLKVVLSWAPHPKALPQAVSNSFLQWMAKTNHDVTVTHPQGYELKESFTQNATIEYDQMKAFEGADIIYTKNWSSYQQYGQILTEDQNWMINKKKMNVTNEAKFMHCLPVRRNVVVTDGVMNGPNALIYQQAGNRLHAAKTVIYNLLKQPNHG